MKLTTGSMDLVKLPWRASVLLGALHHGRERMLACAAVEELTIVVVIGRYAGAGVRRRARPVRSQISVQVNALQKVPPVACKVVEVTGLAI